MKLEPGEQALLATFESFPAAQAAKRELAAAGFGTVQVDRFGEHGYDPEAAFEKPVFGQATTQGITYFDTSGKLSGPDAAVITGGFPEVSGMAGPITARGHAVLLTAVVPAAGADAAGGIIRRHGGRL